MARTRRWTRPGPGQKGLELEFPAVLPSPAKAEVPLDEKSLARLGMNVVGHGGERDVSHPLLSDGIEYRGYQVAMAADAVDRNSLVIMPTGLGKTEVAILTAARRLRENSGRKVLVLAPTKPLVEQHAGEFSRMMSGRSVGTMTGRISPERREGVWRESDVIVATPQTIRNDIERGRVNLEEVSLLVVDEAHRITGNYPYVGIAEKYAGVDGSRILGLTASPGSSARRIMDVCGNLSVSPGNIRIRTGEDEDVLPYVQFVDKHVVRVKPPEVGQVEEYLGGMRSEAMSRFVERGYLADVDEPRTQDIVDEGARIKARISEIETTGDVHGEAYTEALQDYSAFAEVMKINHALRILATHGPYTTSEYLRRAEHDGTKASERIFGDARMVRSMELIHKMLEDDAEFPKMGELVKIAGEHAGKRMIVFTEYRDTVDNIVGGLERKGVSAHGFVGHEHGGMTQAEQMNVLGRFRQGEFDVLVATSIGEEGLDIPGVDAIVFFEPVPDEKRMIQRSGRTGRHAHGEVYVLMAGGTRDEASYYTAMRKWRQMRENVRLLGEMYSGSG